MSIYAGGFDFQLNVTPYSFGDRNWIRITMQSVPSHIGAKWNGYESDIYSYFLPPTIPEELEDEYDRAIVFCHEFDRKGTDRNGQEWHDPLLILTGKEFKEISWLEVMSRLQHAVLERFGENVSTSPGENWSTLWWDSK